MFYVLVSGKVRNLLSYMFMKQKFTLTIETWASLFRNKTRQLLLICRCEVRQTAEYLCTDKAMI
jgi:hypothetical protein